MRPKELHQVKRSIEAILRSNGTQVDVMPQAFEDKLNPGNFSYSFLCRAILKDRNIVRVNQIINGISELGDFNVLNSKLKVTNHFELLIEKI